MIYTIGYSLVKTLENLINISRRYGITCIVDVRTTPYSKYFTEFNASAILENKLKESGMTYINMAEAFGARRKENRLYTENQVDFDKVIEDITFREGVEKLRELSKNYTICLMCAEKNPLDCHRFSMVARGLSEKFYIEVSHFIQEDKIIPHKELEEIMTRDLRCNDKLNAYKILNRRIGYVR